MSAKLKPSRAAASRMPAISPIEASSGVVGVLRLVTAPERISSICRSVNVPPMSTAMRIGDTVALVMRTLTVEANGEWPIANGCIHSPPTIRHSRARSQLGLLGPGRDGEHDRAGRELEGVDGA